MQLAWVCWDHPNMPWDDTELWVADVQQDGSLANNRKVRQLPHEQRHLCGDHWSLDKLLQA